MAQRWEYKFIDTVRAETGGGFFTPGGPGDAVAGLAAELAAVGEDGWEAVGQIVVQQQGSSTPLPVLLLKRPRLC